MVCVEAMAAWEGGVRLDCMDGKVASFMAGRLLCNSFLKRVASVTELLVAVVTRRDRGQPQPLVDCGVRSVRHPERRVVPQSHASRANLPVEAAQQH